MLTKCPECNLQVSDKAYSCPHCGYPLMEPEKQNRRPRTKRRKRLPNGFGQISEIKGRNLRKPFRAMITVGKTETGKPICKPLKPQSYFETYNDAYAALVEQSRNPYDVSKDITMQELYDRWSKEHFKKLTSAGSIKNITSAWKHCEGLYGMKVQELRARHMKSFLESCEASEVTKSRIKMILNMLFDYAIEYELVERNYARELKSAKIEKINRSGNGAHITFTDEEIKILWDHIGESLWIDMMLVQCYSGWRPQELCSLLLENINLEEGWMVGGSKTDAGKNRKVPIHSLIRGLVEKYYNAAKGDCLFGDLKYAQYWHGFTNEIKRLSLNPTHKPHDCRVFFISKAKQHAMDEYAIKLIVGHTIDDITERVYTKRDFSWLKSEIEKIK